MCTRYINYFEKQKFAPRHERRYYYYYYYGKKVRVRYTYEEYHAFGCGGGIMSKRSLARTANVTKTHFRTISFVNYGGRLRSEKSLNKTKDSIAINSNVVRKSINNAIRFGNSFNNKRARFSKRFIRWRHDDITYPITKNRERIHDRNYVADIPEIEVN